MNNQQNILRATSEYMEANRAIAHHLFHHLSSLNRQFLLRSELLDAFKTLCKEDCPELCDSPLATHIHSCQEAALDTSWIYLALRPRIASWMFVRIHLESRSDWRQARVKMTGYWNLILRHSHVSSTSCVKPTRLAVAWSFLTVVSRVDFSRNWGKAISACWRFCKSTAIAINSSC